MGFKEEIAEIVKLAPKKRQTMLFSATFSQQVQALVGMSLKSPVRLAADAALSAPRELTQEVVRLKVCRYASQNITKMCVDEQNLFRC